MEGLFAYPCRRVATPAYPLGAKIRKNRPRCSPTGGFLCSFNTITPKSPHSKPFPIPFASVLGAIGIPLTDSNAFKVTYYPNNIGNTSFDESAAKAMLLDVLKFPSNEVGINLLVSKTTNGIRTLFITIHSGVNYFDGIAISYYFNGKILKFGYGGDWHYWTLD